MTFVPINVAAMMVGNTVQGQTTMKPIVNTSGNNVSYNQISTNGVPFFPYTYNIDITTSSDQRCMKCLATSDANITSNYYTPANIVGNTTVRYTPTSKGWTATITVSGTQGDKINALLFQKGVYGGSYSQALVFAAVLDNEVEIDSSGTANFTFAIEF